MEKSIEERNQKVNASLQEEKRRRYRKGAGQAKFRVCRDKMAVRRNVVI